MANWEVQTEEKKAGGIMGCLSKRRSFHLDRTLIGDAIVSQQPTWFQLNVFVVEGNFLPNI